MEAVNASLARTFQLRFELGLFDPPEDSPYWTVPPTEINTQAAQDLNLLATLSGLVLLRNNHSLLPLPTGKRIALIGPHAMAASAFLGNYLGQICPDNTMSCVTSLNVAIANANVGGTTQVAFGCSINSTNASGIAPAVALAEASDIVILALGIDGTIENEMHDRTEITLPGQQNALAAAIAATGKPTVLLVVNGGTVDISLVRCVLMQCPST
jgi:xylan 1,4-beta-xylosidase